jgi:hypothetical protein
MKYQVQIQYTNPSHEHVSLRRRVETVTRLVEAATEGEALNRAANQQRALGFIIREATVLNPDVADKPENKEKKKKKIVGDDTENTDVAPVDNVKEEVQLEEAKDVTKDLRTSMKMMDLRHGVDSDKRVSGYKMPATIRAAQKKFDAQSKGQGKMRPQAGTLAALKKEAVDPGETRVVNKAVKTSKKATKAAEKMISAAKGKVNKINLQPSVEIDVKSK